MSDHNYGTEKRALLFLSPVGARVYRSTSDAVHRTLYFYRTGTIDQAGDDHFRDKIEPIWTNGIEASRILLLPNPKVVSFDVLCSMMRATALGAAHFIYTCSSHDSSLVPKATIIDSLGVVLEVSR